MFGVVSVVQYFWWCSLDGVRWMVCVLVSVGGSAHGAPVFWLRVRVFVSDSVGVWGRLAALLALCAMLSVVLAVAGPSAHAQADWNQIGLDIDGENANDQSGYSVATNAAGDTVIIGATGNDDYAGHARVFTLIDGVWVQVGADIDGEAAGDQSGWSVAMNAVGDTVIIGATGNDGNGNRSGHARVYELTGGVWVQVGADIDGEAEFDWSGYSVAMDAVGDTVIIGAIYNDVAGDSSGHARVFTLTGGVWVQVGVDIDGVAEGDNSGRSVAMNAAGTRVAIGAVGNDDNGSNSGHARVFTLTDGAWVQVGADIDGEAVGDNSGLSVAMNSSGYAVIIGAPYGNGNSSGHARVFRSAPEPTKSSEAGFAVAVPYPGPFTQMPEPAGAPYGRGTVPNPVAVSPETPTAEPPAAPVPSFTG